MAMHIEEAVKKGLREKRGGWWCKAATYIQQIDPERFSLTYFHLRLSMALLEDLDEYNQLKSFTLPLTRVVAVKVKWAQGCLVKQHFPSTYQHAYLLPCAR